MTDFEIIRDKLIADPENGSHYKEMGDYYFRYNCNQAFLCYEQAEARCLENEKAAVIEAMKKCRNAPGFQVHPASFVILSYNAKEMMIDCLESIRTSCVPSGYEIVIVDNDSKDGIRDYLVQQKDIVLQLNDHNTSFAAGCNQGVKLANPENDIFLLNNDTIVPPLALFYMRMALYSADDIGAVGPTSNAVLISQLAPGSFQSKNEWLANAKNVHQPSEDPIENKAWLVGFALLIRRRAWDSVGNLDERFVRGFFEDTDYGFRLLKAGFRNVLCHNAFIFHYGSVSMKKDPAAYNQAIRNNEKRLNEKLGMEFNRYMHCYTEMINLMNQKKDCAPAVLEIDCGFGLTLSKLKYEYPAAYTAGIEKNVSVAEIGARIGNVICADIEKDRLPFEKKSFDFIFLAEAANRFDDAEKAMTILREYLKDGGVLISLLPNRMNAEAFMELLRGKWESSELFFHWGKHYYTKEEYLKLLRDTGFCPRLILNMVTEYMKRHPEESKTLETISALPGVAIGKDFQTQSYYITATIGK